MKVKDLGVCVMCDVYEERSHGRGRGGLYIHSIPYCLESVKLEHSLAIAEESIFHQYISILQGCLLCSIVLGSLPKPTRSK